MRSPTEGWLRDLGLGSVDFLGQEDLVDTLKEGRPLRIKAGFDPTRPDLHLGHAALLGRLLDLQRGGHTVMFVVGDFTASIGDPSGRNKLRPPLSKEEIAVGAKTYAEQAFKILKRDQTTIHFNGDWLGSMNFADVVRLSSKYTLARMMERQDFKTRWENNEPLALHELLYPLAQAQDSVHLQPDIEVGGTDQLFNLMVGRNLMKENGQRPQAIMTFPLLEGIRGGDKMSKSLDNFVGITESASEQVGKIMSISDELLWKYVVALEPILGIDPGSGRARRFLIKEQQPREAKLLFAEALVSRFHSQEEAFLAREGWERQFSRKEAPTEMPEVHLKEVTPVTIVRALLATGLVSSGNEAQRKLEEGAVKLDGDKTLKDRKHILVPGTHVLKLGRKWARVIVSEL